VRGVRSTDWTLFFWYMRAQAIPNTQVYSPANTDQLNENDKAEVSCCFPSHRSLAINLPDGDERMSKTGSWYLASFGGHDGDDDCIRLSRVHDVNNGLQLACTELIVVKALSQKATSATRNTGAIHGRLPRRTTDPLLCKGSNAAVERVPRDVPCLRPNVCRPCPLSRSC